MSVPPASSSNYATLLQGDHGFILALALTVLAIVALTFFTKLYFTWGRFNASRKDLGSIGYSVLASDAMWLLVHFLAFAYLGIRISTLRGLTEDSNALTAAQKAFLAHENQACQILFILSLYLSFCSVLCTTLAIPSMSVNGNFAFLSPTYVAPLGIFILGLLLCTLPQIGCDDQYIFQGMQDYCPSANARIIPVIIVIIILDLAVPIYWAAFVYRRNSHIQAGRVTPRQPLPVAPFMLRFLIVGANIAYLDLHIRANSGYVPHYSIIYPELLSILVSLTATTSVSMSRILGKFNFAGVAYTVDYSNRVHDGSAGGGSRMGTRTDNKTQAQIQVRNGSAWAPAAKDADGWKDPAAPGRSNVSVKAKRRGSAESEIQMLQNDAIHRKVEVQQVWEESTSTKSHSSL